VHQCTNGGKEMPAGRKPIKQAAVTQGSTVQETYT
jgi:hypothetical protein